ncbi:hypothetical protein CW304_19685 [Bacillus sp. UFRGS-B20]|nr:hypothetical protein CW304_19685 [Bacillus sp. UFRGS-B20]
MERLDKKPATKISCQESYFSSFRNITKRHLSIVNHIFVLRMNHSKLKNTLTNQKDSGKANLTTIPANKSIKVKDGSQGRKRDGITILFKSIRHVVNC